MINLTINLIDNPGNKPRELIQKINSTNNPIRIAYQINLLNLPSQINPNK